MRALKCDEYTHAEIAFMFETREATVAKHINKNCHHQSRTPEYVNNPDGKPRTYSDEDLLAAYRQIYDKQPYERMSQSAYDSHRTDHDPSSSTIIRRFGSWPNARALVWGDEDE